MGEQLLDNVRVDRRAFSVTTLAEAEREDRDFWRSRTPDERLAALELSRQIAYGTLSCRSVGSGRGAIVSNDHVTWSPLANRLALLC